MITKILSQSSFWMVNKSIAKYLKCNDSALLLSEFIDKYDFFKSKNELTNDFFYYTSEMIENSVNISYHEQKKCIKNLKDVGFIDTKLMGVPAKLHFKIIENKILKFLNTGYEEIQIQDVKKIETINTIRNNTLDKNQNNNINESIFLSELDILLDVFNDTMKTRIKNTGAVLPNYIYWRKFYEPKEIEFAIRKISDHEFWKNRMTFETFFRKKNTAKEPVNYISDMLNHKESGVKAEMKTAFQQSLEKIWKDE